MLGMEERKKRSYYEITRKNSFPNEKYLYIELNVTPHDVQCNNNKTGEKKSRTRNST